MHASQPKTRPHRGHTLQVYSKKRENSGQTCQFFGDEYQNCSDKNGSIAAKCQNCSKKYQNYSRKWAQPEEKKGTGRDQTGSVDDTVEEIPNGDSVRFETARVTDRVVRWYNRVTAEPGVSVSGVAGPEGCWVVWCGRA